MTYFAVLVFAVLMIISAVLGASGRRVPPVPRFLLVWEFIALCICIALIAGGYMSQDVTTTNRCHTGALFVVDMYALISILRMRRPSNKAKGL